MKTIVVGLDNSKRAPSVLHQALDLARAHEAKLFVVRAVGIPVEFPVEALSLAPDALPTRMIEITQRALDKDVAALPASVLSRAEARLGTPWQVICDTAKELQADAIVIGTHGHGALDRLLGTTAARVVNHAPCSVLVVREAAK